VENERLVGRVFVVGFIGYTSLVIEAYAAAAAFAASAVFGTRPQSTSPADAPSRTCLDQRRRLANRDILLLEQFRWNAAGS